MIADKGYGRGKTYALLKAFKIRSYIPLHHDNLGQGRISKGNFIYNEKKDIYICPEKHELFPYEKTDRGIKRYRVLGGHCKNCQFRETCLPEKHKNRSRFIYRSPYQNEIDIIKNRQKTIYFKKKLIERKWKIEGLFGEAKENHCLRRAKFRGLLNVQIQVYMITIVQNIKRIFKYFYKN